MSQRWSKNRVKYLCLIAVLLLLVSCEKVVDTGSFKNLEIGQTKLEVLETLKSDRTVSAIKPDIENKVEFDGSLFDNIEDLYGSDGISVQGPNYSVQLYFESDTLTDIVLTSLDQNNTLGIERGMHRRQVLLLIEQIVKERESFRAFSFPAHSRWVMLDELSSEDIGYLNSFDVWGYHENNTHSYTLLVFEKGRLHKIIYSWSPMELP